MSVLTRFKDAFITKKKPLAEGIYHLRKEGEDFDVRLHLRIDPGGEGILMINASRVLHLNRTGAEMSRYIIEGLGDEEIVATMKKRYRGVSKKRLADDLARLRETIEMMAAGDKRCPVSYLGAQRVEPFTIDVTVPYRMDVALTYGCNNSCPHCYNVVHRDGDVLDLDGFKRVIDKLWGVGVPHVTFTGGEPTESPYLLELVEHAEELGVIAGVLTNGRKMADGDYVRSLAEAGLDHVQITIESADPAVHDEMVGVPGALEQTIAGIKNVVASPVYLVTNTTITKKNADGLEELISFLSTLGVDNAAANGIIYSGDAATIDYALRESELAPYVARMRDACYAAGMTFTWYTPTQYCRFNPLELDIGVKYCTAAKYNMCVEPDGTVLPCQSYYEPLGNILTDDWSDIYNHDVAKGIRERGYAPEKCDGCPDIEICGAGCPLVITAQETVCCPDYASNP